MVWWKFCCERLNIPWITTDDENMIRLTATYTHVSTQFLQNKFGKPPELLYDSSFRSSSDSSSFVEEERNEQIERGTNKKQKINK